MVEGAVQPAHGKVNLAQLIVCRGVAGIVFENGEVGVHSLLWFADKQLGGGIDLLGLGFQLGLSYLHYGFALVGGWGSGGGSFVAGAGG